MHAHAKTAEDDLHNALGVSLPYWAIQLM